MRRLALLGAAALVVAGVALVPSAEASTAYSFGVAFGTNSASQLPVTLTLPAPSDGSAVTSVTFKWNVTPAPWATSAVQPGYGGQQVVDTTASCVAGADCTVDATLTTGTMANATDTIQVVATSTSGVLGSTTGSVAIHNAKPSVSAAWPTTSAEWSPWGQTMLTASPAPSTDGIAIKDVRLYDSSSSTALPIAEADGAPWDLAFDASVLGSQDTTGTLRLLVEDTAGNTSVVLEKYVVEPPASVGTGFADGDAVGSTLNTETDIDLIASVPDSVTISTQEQYAGNPVTWPAGISGFAVALDGGTPVQLDWASFWTNTATPSRSLDYVYGLPTGITAGRHTLTLTAETTYGAESTTTTHFVIADGANFSPITAGGKPVTSNSTFAVGRTSLLSTTATARTSGSWLSSPTVQGTSFTLASAQASGQTARGATGYAITGAFHPTKPGAYLLTFCVASSGSVPCGGDATVPKQNVSKLVIAEYATKLAITRTAISGGRRVVHGTVKDSVKGTGLARVPVHLQRRQGTKWISVASATSTTAGAVTITLAKSGRAAYRLVSSGVAKTDMAATSATMSF